MKKFTITLILAISTFISWNVSADTYAGFYGIASSNVTNTAGDYDSGNVNIAFGQSVGKSFGVGYEAFFNRSGLGGSVEVFTTINDKYKVSLGAISVPDSAERIPVSSWPKTTSNEDGKGAYIGLSFPLSENRHFGMKYIRYDVDHSFTSSKQTGVDGMGNPIFTSQTGTGSAEREQLWVGLTFHI